MLQPSQSGVDSESRGTCRRRRPGPSRRGLKMDARARANGAPGRRILVADDHEAVRLLCRINLEHEGMVVTEASDGVEALRLARSGRFDLILLDLMMPGLDGWSVADALLAGAATCRVPIVFFSARAQADDRARAYELGIVGYVVKPFNPVELGTL